MLLLKHLYPILNFNRFAYLFFYLCVCFFMCSCDEDRVKVSSLVDAIPKDAQIILKINDPEGLKPLLRNQEFIQKNKKNVLIQYLDELPVATSSDQPRGLLCFSPVGKNNYEFTYIAKTDINSIAQDSLSTKKVETISYANSQLFKITGGESVLFATQKDSIFMVSSSQLLIENAIREQNKNHTSDPDLVKAYEVSDALTPVSLLVNGTRLDDIRSMLTPNLTLKGIQNFSGWISGDVTMNQTAMYLDGIVIEKDSLSSTIGIFDNTLPQENKIAAITPVSAKGFISYTYDDFSTLKKNLALAQDRDVPDVPETLDDVLSGVSEIGRIFLEKEEILTLTSIDAEKTASSLQGTRSGTYRGIPIFSFENPQRFSSILHPLIPEFEARYFFQSENFFVFAATKSGLQHCIASLQNSTLLSNQTYYQTAMEKLSDASSMLLVGSTEMLQQKIVEGVQESYQDNWKSLKIDAYPIAALQIIKENNYAHLHVVFQKNASKETITSVEQIASVALENPLLNTPALMYNHRTKGKDIVVQDINNNLYLISDKGTILWKKQLESAILGDIQQLDIYKNGRYQLVFVTENKLHLLDRNGNTVPPYPISFSDEITQPLALFDYDKNKRYRLVVTQKNKVTMLDAKG